MSNRACHEDHRTIRLIRPEKWRQALRGRNLARNIRVSDAPTAHQTLGGFLLPRVVLIHQLDIGAMPIKILRRGRS